MNQTKLLDAALFAAKAHGLQTRKGTSVPYIVHPLAVARMLAELGCAESLVIAGLLHDTVEDAGAGLSEIEWRFGPKTASLVEAASEDKSKSWEERKRHTVESVKDASEDLLLLICADKLDNLRSIKEGLAKDGAALWSRFKRPMEGQRWYYARLAEAFHSRTVVTGAVLLESYAALYKEVFGDWRRIDERGEADARAAQLTERAPGCETCRTKMKFVAHTGGGAGMVYLIFRCPNCQTTKALK